MTDKDCICKGNWRELVQEYEPLIGRIYIRDYDNTSFVFFGLVHGGDDYYYALWNHLTKELQLLSCVGDIVSFGYTLKEKP